MFGWRATIGGIFSRRGHLHVSAREMEMVLPDGVLLNNTYLEGPKSLTKEHLLETFEEIGPAAMEVNRIPADLIIQVGAPISLVHGVDGDKKIIDEIEKATGIPATTCISSIVEALHRLCIEKVVVVTPYYKEEMTVLVRNFLEHKGFTVVSLVQGGDVEFKKNYQIPQEHTYRLAKNAFLKNPADGLLIVGGGAPTESIVEILETDIGKPVISQNFAAIWNALRIANVRQPIPNYGMLLKSF